MNSKNSNLYFDFFILGWLHYRGIYININLIDGACVHDAFLN